MLFLATSTMYRSFIPIHPIIYALSIALLGSPLYADEPKKSYTFLLTPNVMTECENGICSTWTFEPNGKTGTAQWQNGATAHLTVERFDYRQIIIRRVDATGASSGLGAYYTGKIEGNRIVGDVTWSWPAHWSDQTPRGTWYASFTPLRAIPINCDPNKNSTGSNSTTSSAPETPRGPRNSADFLSRHSSSQASDGSSSDTASISAQHPTGPHNSLSFISRQNQSGESQACAPLSPSSNMFTK